MVIDPGNNVNSSSNATGKARQSSARPSDASADSGVKKQTEAATDSVTLSNTGHSLNRLEAAVANAHDVNAEKIAEIKAALDNGTYEVDTQAVANKILTQDDLT